MAQSELRLGQRLAGRVRSRAPQPPQRIRQHARNMPPRMAALAPLEVGGVAGVGQRRVHFSIRDRPAAVL